MKGVAILILGKIDFKSKIIRGKEGDYIIIKGSIHQEDITIINIYVPTTEFLNLGSKHWQKRREQ